MPQEEFKIYSRIKEYTSWNCLDEFHYCWFAMQLAANEETNVNNKFIYQKNKHFKAAEYFLT